MKRWPVGWMLALAALSGCLLKEDAMSVSEATAGQGAPRAGQQPALPPPDGVEVRRDVVYGRGGGRDLKLDLFLPENAKARKPMPGMVFIHGGGWVGGGPTQFHRQCGSLATKGMVCASIAYRLSGEAKYPAAVEDAKCAVRWMRANAADLNVDPERIGCGGGSAGGHLSAMLATTAHLQKLEGSGGHAGVSSRVCLAVLFNPVTDMRFGETTGGGPTAVLGFLGAQPDEKPDLYAEASPITHVSKGSAPCLLFHGTADTTVPHAQSVRFRDALRAASVAAELVSVEGQAHAFFNRSPHYESTYAKMEAWLGERFGL